MSRVKYLGVKLDESGGNSHNHINLEKEIILVRGKQSPVIQSRNYAGFDVLHAVVLR